MSLEQHWPYKSSIYNIYTYIYRGGRGKLLARDEAQNFRKAFHVRERTLPCNRRTRRRFTRTVRSVLTLCATWPVAPMSATVEEERRRPQAQE